jgi:hypothetical protein
MQRLHIWLYQEQQGNNRLVSAPQQGSLIEGRTLATTSSNATPHQQLMDLIHIPATSLAAHGAVVDPGDRLPIRRRLKSEHFHRARAAGSRGTTRNARVAGRSQSDQVTRDRRDLSGDQQ